MNRRALIAGLTREEIYSWRSKQWTVRVKRGIRGWRPIYYGSEEDARCFLNKTKRKGLIKLCHPSAVTPVASL